MGFITHAVSGVFNDLNGNTTASAAKSSAATQADAANRAVDLYQTQYADTKNALAPYVSLGSSVQDQLTNQLNSSALNSTFTAPTAADAAATPGYQFTLDNGLKSVQNSASARGLGVSGAAQKGAASYASGLADSTYNDRYNQALSTFNTNQSAATSQYNKLLGLTTLGENAAAGTAAAGATAASNEASALTSGAASTAAGTVAAANANVQGTKNLISLGTSIFG